MNDEPTWKAGVLLYSGRPDPSWSVAPANAAAWVRSFECLMRTCSPAPNQSRLGYRGAWLQDPQGRRWNVFGSVAWRDDDGRADTGRVLEQRLLESAPSDLLPKEWRTWLAPEA